MRRLPMLLVVLALPALADGFVVIRNAGAGTTPMTRDDAKGTFTGRVRAWSTGPVVAVVLQPESSPAFKWLAEAVFGGNEKMLSSKIKQEVFKGDMAKPTTAASDQETIDKVKDLPGGVGVISADAAKGLPAQVLVVKLSGVGG